MGEDCQGDDGAWRLLNSVFCIEPTDGATTTTTAISTVTGVIISGGWNGTLGIATTEVFFPSSSGSGHTCSLQSMPSTRYAHTLDQLGDGVLACGGGGGADTLKTCDRFDGTSWSRHSTLQYKRVHHNSLAGQHGLLLMGGQYPLSPTELVVECCLSQERRCLLWLGDWVLTADIWTPLNYSMMVETAG